MQIKVSVTDTGPVNLPGDLRGVLENVADDWSREVVERTRSGRDATGRALRRKRDGSVSRLTDTGRMLRSFGPRHVDEGGFVLGPSRGRNATIAYVNQARGRKWIGASDEQVQAARDAIARAVERT